MTKQMTVVVIGSLRVINREDSSCADALDYKIVGPLSREVTQSKSFLPPF